MSMYDYTLVTSATHNDGSGYQSLNFEVQVYKAEHTGVLMYVKTSYCSCCGPAVRETDLLILELGSFILMVRKWGREIASSSDDREALSVKVNRLIQRVINASDGAHQAEVKSAQAKIEFTRNKLSKLTEQRDQVIAKMDKMISSVSNDLDAAHAEYNKLVD